MRIIIIYIIIAATVTACYYDNEEYLYPQSGTDCDTVTVTYSVSVKSVLEQNCLSCHSNSTAPSIGGNIKLENYADVKLRADDGSLQGSVLHESSYSPMPKGAQKLDDCSISIIQNWINSGSPEN